MVCHSYFYLEVLQLLPYNIDSEKTFRENGRAKEVTKFHRAPSHQNDNRQKGSVRSNETH